VLHAHPIDVPSEIGPDRRRQHRRAILAAFAVANRDLAGGLEGLSAKMRSTLFEVFDVCLFGTQNPLSPAPSPS
jgi:hypothetical protein